MHWRLLLLTLLLGLLCACSRTYTDIEQYERDLFSDESPMRQSFERNGVVVSVQYMPTDAVLLPILKFMQKERESIEQDTVLTAEERVEKLGKISADLQRQRESFDKSLYFRMTIGYTDDDRDIVFDSMRGGFDQYSEWLQRLLFHLPEYVYLETAKIDEVPLFHNQMDRTYGMTKSRTIMLVFPREFNEMKLLDRKQKRLELHIDEFGLHTGDIEFTWDLPLDQPKLDDRLFRS